MNTKQPTEEQWKEIEESATSFFNKVKIKCDDFIITLSLERKSVYQNEIVVYVDGKIKSEWFLNDCEIRRRFYREKTTKVFPRNRYSELKKMSRSSLKKMGIDINQTVSVYYPTWTNFNSLKRHLIKNCKSIEFVE